MIIGILTYHRSHNFGALFQAIATCNLLRSEGHSAYIIDYWPKYHQAMYSLFSVWAMKQKKFGAFRYIVESLQNLPSKKIRKRKYEAFIDSYIIPLCAPQNMCFDIIVYGSDQIWRKQPYINCFNPVYFGQHGYQSKRHISYAASMGKILLTDKEKQFLAELLSHFDKISVREKELLSLVSELGYTDAQLCLDPAILLTASQWNSIFGNPTITDDKYVLFVNYIKDSFDEKAIRDFANRKGLKFVKINGSVTGKDSPDAEITAGPLELFNLIRAASYVFTSSFHAMIFSLIYKKQFYAAFANNSDRATSILCSLDISERFLKSKNSPIIDSSIDYNRVDDKIERLKKSSLDYLFTL